MDVHWTYSDSPVEFDVGLFLPESFTADLTNTKVPGIATMRLEVEIRDGQPWCRSISMVAEPDGPGVVPASLRDVPLRQLLGVLAFELADENMDRFRPDGPSLPSASRAALAHIDRQERARAALSGRRRVTPDLLKRVADVYSADESGRPTQAVANEFNVSHSTAARYVGSARKQKLLPGTSPGKATRTINDEENR